MSLLKLRRIVDKNTRNMSDVLLDFQMALDIYVDNTNEENLAKVIDAYSEYGYLYLYKASRTLKPDKDAKDHMTYMNSIIAEACREVGVPYFSSNGGYSIIDKSVAYLVDNGIQQDIKYVVTLIEEIKKSKDEE